VKLLGFYFCLVLLLVCPSLHAQTPNHSEKSASASCGPLADQVLRCPRFGFTYEVIFGWVDRTEEMQQDANAEPTSGAPNSDDTSKQQEQQQPSSSGSETLLAVFERPPAAPGETIDSAVVIAAEPLANYHEVKTAADYFGAITELAEQRGFKVENDPHPFSVGTKRVVRGDFSKERGKLTMYQSSLVVIEKRYIVSFTFIGGSEDEVDDLIGNLSFAAERSAARTSKGRNEGEEKK